jgi:predicted Ser/Thr protein kinase
VSDAYLPLKFGNYLIEELVGQGGMGVVYRARHTYLDRLAALKIIHDFLVRDPLARERFLREAQVAAQLKHEHIAQVYDFGEDEGHYYLAMEYIAGQGLDQLLHAGPLPLPRALVLLDQVASALDYLRQQGVVHRDLKPSNILVTPEDRIAIVDFGIATALAATRVSREGEIVGTLAYCAPEQLQGGAITPHVDSYALGVIAYEMLTGQLPFAADTPQGLIWLIAFEEPLLPRSLRPDLPETVERVLLKQLAKTPAARYPSAHAFLTALRAAARLQPYTPLAQLTTPPPGLPEVPRVDYPPPGLGEPGPPSEPGRRAHVTPPRSFPAARPSRRARWAGVVAVVALISILGAALLGGVLLVASGGMSQPSPSQAAEGEQLLLAARARPPLVGPLSGTSDAAGPALALADLVAEVQIANPASASWRYGLAFRQSEGAAYRVLVGPPGWVLLGVGEAGRWELALLRNPPQVLAKGSLPIFNTSPESSNRLVLIAAGPRGYLWVNDGFAGALDLGAHTDAGRLSVVSEGEPVTYRELRIWALAP